MDISEGAVRRGCEKHKGRSGMVAINNTWAFNPTPILMTAVTESFMMHANNSQCLMEGV